MLGKFGSVMANPSSAQRGWHVLFFFYQLASSSPEGSVETEWRLFRNRVRTVGWGGVTTFWFAFISVDLQVSLSCSLRHGGKGGKEGMRDARTACAVDSGCVRVQASAIYIVERVSVKERCKVE